MRIGIIEAGVPPEALVPTFGTYDSMTRRLLGPDHDYETYRVFDGRLPGALAACDAYAITGSRCGVGDGLAWVDALVDFLRAAAGKVPMVGICFGHQVMAHALGGTVQRAPQGWGLGLHRYEVRLRAEWMDDADVVFATASHQDQVVAPPPGARVLADSGFTPFAVLDYPGRAAMSVQFHPEFEPAFSRALLEARRPQGVTEGQRRAAIASLGQQNDNPRIGRWISAFLAIGAPA